jgi:hypothetical protein
MCIQGQGCSPKTRSAEEVWYAVPVEIKGDEFGDAAVLLVNNSFVVENVKWDDQQFKISMYWRFRLERGVRILHKLFLYFHQM